MSGQSSGAAAGGRAQPARIRASAREVLPAAAVVAATAGSSTALTAVIDGATWFGYILIAALLVATTGVALRALRAPTAVVGLGQIAALLLLITGAFTESAVAAIIPGPDAFAELDLLLSAAFDQIRTGLPPVPATPAILCLLTIAIGLVAIVVDTLVVPLGAPAVSGLVLLCVYAVPASLSDSLLPWWTFALGAGAFAALLAVHGEHRHRNWRTREVPATTTRSGAVATPVTMLAVAVVVGLIAGSAVTGVGTIGKLPGTGGNARTVAGGGLGIHPFTSLRGLLNRDEEVPMFRVRGLGEEQRLLRAFTLRRYQPNQGWTLPKGPMPSGVSAEGALPNPEGAAAGENIRKIRIEPLNWQDVWLPVYGTPQALGSIEQGWFYDPASGTVFRKRSARPGPYVEFADISQPTQEQLRESDSNTATVSPAYSRISYVDPRVEALAERITADATTRYEKARALWEHFSPVNGFSYSLSTAPASDANALADFLLNGKRGYCEQYASAMAVMLRSLDIPSRVAIGFTTGYPEGGHRTITSHDAHAWVEVYFSGLGWVNFDPTPLADGRGFTPSYLQDDDSATAGARDSDNSTADTQNNRTEQLQDRLSDLSGSAAAPTPEESAFPARAPTWAGWAGVAVVALALALTIATVLLIRRVETAGTDTARHQQLRMLRLARWLPAAAGATWIVVLLLAGWQVHWTLAVAVALLGMAAIAPALVRETLRRRRLHTVAADTPESATAAWDELRDECADRGLTIGPGDTLRSTARRVTDNNQLDADGRDALGTVVGAVERQWYAPAGARDAVDVRESSLAHAFSRLRHSLAKAAPLPPRARLLPRSVLNRSRER